MNFRVYAVIEIPIIDQICEILIPADRRIYEVINALKKAIKELSNNYYSNHSPIIYNKSTGEIYDMNLIIKDSNIKMGTRLLLI